MIIPTPNPTIDGVIDLATGFINQSSDFVLFAVGLGVGLAILGAILRAVRDSDVV